MCGGFGCRFESGRGGRRFDGCGGHRRRDDDGGLRHGSFGRTRSNGLRRNDGIDGCRGNSWRLRAARRGDGLERWDGFGGFGWSRRGGRFAGSLYRRRLHLDGRGLRDGGRASGFGLGCSFCRAAKHATHEFRDGILDDSQLIFCFETEPSEEADQIF